MVTPTLEEISATLENHAVFVVIAETLDAWQPPSTPEGRKVLHAHHLWAMEVRAKGRLLFAGPLDMGAHGPASPPSIGAPTGLLVLRAASKAEAEEMAQQDPLHRGGFRRNVVHAWSIRWGESEITSAVGAVLATPLR
ncbi:MAG: hypothetical protein IPQ09_26225 [Myxococcales bacterium]|nr:hypothetical protein [Myxococcales bacterium]